MELSWLEDPVLGPDILVKDLLIAGGILFIGLALAIMIPGIISRWITGIFVNRDLKRYKKKKKRTENEVKAEKGRIDRRFKKSLQDPLKRSIAIAIIFISFFTAVFSMNLGLDSQITLGAVNYTSSQFLQILVVLSILIILILVAIEPLLRAAIYSLLSDSYSKSRKYRLFRAIRFPIKLTLLLLGMYILLNITFTRGQLDELNWLMKFLAFALILLFSYLIGQLFVTLTEPTFKGNDRTTRSAGKAVGRMIKVAIYLVGGLVGLAMLGLDPLTLATSLGLIGFALAFGLQDTVANLAAGILIALDKPFVIGDRIRIDWGGSETWGDVRDISLRSTWIKTPEGEMIVIPNNVIASSQVWNYTRDSPKVALNFDVGISYDSDWKLAEKLILEVLKKHPLVLNTPSPYVLMKAFGDSSQVMTLWFWIPEARDKVVIQSDILKKVKDSFDRNGIEIPFPYRTLVYKSDMPNPKVLGEEYQSPLFLPSTGFKEFKVNDGEVVEMGISGSVVLAPTSSSYPARYTAPYVMETAKKMGASVSALFIKTTGSNILEGQKALRIYNEVAKRFGVDIKLLYKEGDVLENILIAVEQENASIVVMGSTEETLFGSLTKRSISQELLLHLHIPTMIIPMNVSRLPPAEIDYENGDVKLDSIRDLENLEKKAMEE